MISASQPPAPYDILTERDPYPMDTNHYQVSPLTNQMFEPLPEMTTTN